MKVISGFEDSLLSTLKISACHLPLFSFPPVSQPLLSLSPFFTCARLEILAFIPSGTAFKNFISFTFSLFLFSFCFPFLNFLSCFDVPLLPLLLSANSFLLPFPSFQTWHPLKFLSSQQCSVPYLAYPLYHLHAILILPNYYPPYPQLSWNCFFQGCCWFSSCQIQLQFQWSLRMRFKTLGICHLTRWVIFVKYLMALCLFCHLQNACDNGPESTYNTRLRWDVNGLCKL